MTERTTGATQTLHFDRHRDDASSSPVSLNVGDSMSLKMETVAMKNQRSSGELDGQVSGDKWLLAAFTVCLVAGAYVTV